MTWSAQQDAALAAVAEWLARRGGPQVFRLFGYAGTGKTTIAKEIAAMPKTRRGRAGETLFAAFTGKAALMMRRKGCAGASTIHSLIYKPAKEAEDDDVAADGGIPFVLNSDSALARADLLVIDECSMVDENLARDMLSFGKKILVIGDPAQLPPVDGAGYFTGTSQPNVMLTEIHRQARDNPIIAMATDVREGRDLAFGGYGSSSVMRRRDLMQSHVKAADQLLCGMNRTRVALNAKLRGLRFPDLAGTPALTETPLVGERLVCLRNQRKKGLLNGGLWTVASLDEPKRRDHNVTRMSLTSEDFEEGPEVEVGVPNEFFSADLEAVKLIPGEKRRALSEFTFGYALTAHKAQGSQWPNVLVLDESFVFREDRARWLYTALTRAAETVTVVRDR